jgi:hypothetical protein
MSPVKSVFVPGTPTKLSPGAFSGTFDVTDLFASEG